MKKIAVLLVFALTLSLCGCAAGTQAPSDDPAPTVVTTTAPTEGGYTPPVTSDKSAFLKALAKTESKAVFSDGGEIRKRERDDLFVLYENTLYLVDADKAISQVTAAKELTVENVQNYWICENAVMCYGTDERLILWKDGRLYTLALPETFTKKQVTPIDYQNGYLLCREEPTGLWLYDIAAEGFTEVSPHQIEGAAMLDGVVYYGCLDREGLVYELNAFQIDTGETTVLCDPVADTTIAFPTFYGRTILWAVAPPMDSPAHYTYQSWNVDDAKWVVWHKAVAEQYSRLVPQEQGLLACTDSETGFFLWHRVDAVTGESEPLYPLPTSSLYWPAEDDYVYWLDGEYLYKMPLPPAEEP